MAYVIGDLIDAASYKTYITDYKTNTGGDKLQAKLGGTSDIEGAKKDLYIRNGEKTYNVIWNIFNLESIGSFNVTPIVRFFNASGTKIFEWETGTATPQLNTLGWAYLQNSRTQSIKIPASDTKWQYQSILRDDGAFSHGYYEWKYDFYQADTSMQPGYRVIVWDSLFATSSELTSTEDDSRSGLDKTKGDRALYGAEPVTGDGYIRFHGNGETSGVMSDQTIANYASANLTVNAFIKTGYTFLGWDTDADAIVATYSDEESYTMSYLHDKVLYAIWEVI